jgi:hypothetical protein
LLAGRHDRLGIPPPRLPSGGLPTGLVVTEDAPHPSPELATIAAML